MKAQASRGADLSQRFWQPHKLAKIYLPLIVPLFLNALQRAEELILAMEARCYISGEGRTSFVVLYSTVLDWIVVALVLTFSLFTLFFQWPAIKSILAGFGLHGL
jgi:energy-coupling factor transport system permease protein